VLWSSMIKDTMKRKKPSFNESYHGYRTFSELLEDAQKEGLLELDTDKRSRTYVVTRFGSEMQQAGGPAVREEAGKKKSRRRRSGGKRRGRGENGVQAPTAASAPAAPAEGRAREPKPAEDPDLESITFSRRAEPEPAERPRRAPAPEPDEEEPRPEPRRRHEAEHPEPEEEAPAERPESGGRRGGRRRKPAEGHGSEPGAEDAE